MIITHLLCGAFPEWLLHKDTMRGMAWCGFRETQAATKHGGEFSGMSETAQFCNFIICHF